jgi:hypothetical protein
MKSGTKNRWKVVATSAVIWYLTLFCLTNKAKRKCQIKLEAKTEARTEAKIEANTEAKTDTDRP